METKDFYYDLPEELIAQHPLEKRDESRLLVLDKETGKTEHKQFKDIVDYFKPGDTLVLNDTRVMPARIFGNRPGKDERNEFLLIKEVEKDVWECMVRPGKKARVGQEVEFGDGQLKAKVLDITETGTRLVDFSYEGIFFEVLESLGEMPIPPYIHEVLEEKERYQTVYSKDIGSAAAPTAGLHFTQELLKEIEDKGVDVAYLTLHVGLGTFMPVKVEVLEEHDMHSEYYSIDQETADKINNTRGNLIAVGTTTSRTLESVADKDGKVQASSGWTDIFIYPGYDFKIVDKLITNFHLPESTLLMLVSALAGKEKILDSYIEAVEREYRFFSFGDAMYIK